MNGNKFKAARKYGYRSGLELKVSQYLDTKKIVFKYEAIKIEWEDLAYRTYTPDFILPNNIIIEVKGRFITQDRRKHREIKKQHPDLDIRFVFENSNRKLYKGAKTTYREWCIRYGFLYYDRIVPESWLKEKKHPKIETFVAFKEKRTT
mgnify:FL=1|tara:strand:- start:213 stop:659 length:447 start_codon:yes stop_codon:yes gene_type:complete